MQKIVTWINGLSLKKKIIYYTYAVIVPILLVICSCMLVYNFDKAQTLNNETNFHNLQSLSDNTETVMEDVENLSTYIVINQEINKILTATSTEKLNKDHQLWEHEAPIKMVEDMMALKGYIKTVAIYPENGVVPYLRCTDSSSYMTKLKFVKKSDTYKNAVVNRGKTAWRHVQKGGEDVFIASRTEKLVMYREIFNATKKNPLGYLVLGIPVGIFDKFFLNELYDDETEKNEYQKNTSQLKTGIIVYNKEHQQLFQYGSVKENIKTQIESSGLIQLDEKITDKAVEYNGYTIYIHRGIDSKITICKIEPRKNFWQMANAILYMPIAVLFGVLLGLLPVLWIVSNIVTKPLLKVCNAMGKFKRGDFEQRLVVKTTDEIGEVANCFNKMVKDIKELINTNYVIALKERESELSLLQAQIDPHFLYNTLDSLYWQACNSDNEEIAENIYALSRFFRLVLGSGKDIVEVREEIELVTRYLEIQKMRFTKRIEYEINVEDSVKDVKIPKLILQPFVENAVIHGIEGTTKQCVIRISVKADGNQMIVEISDSGVGMTKEQLEKVWNGIKSEGMSDQSEGGYAIKNVKERLELKYRKYYKLKIKSTIGQGTIVKLILPIEREEEKVCL